jgi:acyl carrier protein
MKRDEFVQMMAELLEAEPSEILPDSSLYDFPSYDSVCALTLMVKLEEDAQVVCSPAELAILKTVGDIERLITRYGNFES